MRCIYVRNGDAPLVGRQGSVRNESPDRVFLGGFASVRNSTVAGRSPSPDRPARYSEPVTRQWRRSGTSQIRRARFADGVGPEPNVVVLGLFAGQAASSSSGSEFAAQLASCDTRRSRARSAALRDGKIPADGLPTARVVPLLRVATTTKRLSSWDCPGFG